MSVADEIAGFVQKPAPACSVCVAIGKLPTKTQTEFKTVLAERKLPVSACARWLAAKADHKVSAGSVAHHRNQGH